MIFLRGKQVDLWRNVRQVFSPSRRQDTTLRVSLRLSNLRRSLAPHLLLCNSFALSEPRMDTNIGVPSEILVLCTSAETKEKALSLFEQIRQNKSAGVKITMDAALPAVCSLIASEQCVIHISNSHNSYII